MQKFPPIPPIEKRFSNRFEKNEVRRGDRFYVLRNLHKSGDLLFMNFIDHTPEVSGESWRDKRRIQSWKVTKHIYEAGWYGYEEGKHKMVLSLPNIRNELFDSIVVKVNADEVFLTREDAEEFLEKCIKAFRESPGSEEDIWAKTHFIFKP